MSLPLCSLVIVTYNQEAFIRQTLQAAFAQTYPHLEIVVSDDASTDRTWEIVQAEAASYAGPHRLTLNRNERNLGIGGGAGKAIQLAAGEILVWNDGDDISLPNRVQCIVNFFEKQGSQTMMVWSRHEPIDSDGKVLGVYKNFEKDVRKKARTLADVRRRIRIPFGAVTAWRRVVSDMFSPIPPAFGGWDNIIAFRALLMGKIAPLPEVLVQYRTHNASTTNAPAADDLVKDYRKRAIHRDAWFVQAYSQYLIDLHQVLRVSPERRSELLRIERLIISLIKKWSVSYEIMTAFPRLSLGMLVRTLPWPEFYRYFLLAPLYRLGLYKRRKG
ncbi:MAG: glycosyltransferase [Verrucomicrobia bacterium]|nr:glycosyltransferase [Verrucomicrobiota bacterium]